MNNRTYVIIEADDVSTVDFDEVMETSADTLRWSVDESQTFVKFVGDTPSFLVGKTQYNHDEIRAVLATEDWTTPHE
tara:strand:+ start:569 stop:799 length:231 start_codon:yes stop_codon:yes gene_type:complete